MACTGRGCEPVFKLQICRYWIVFLKFCIFCRALVTVMSIIPELTGTRNIVYNYILFEKKNKSLSRVQEL